MATCAADVVTGGDVATCTADVELCAGVVVPGMAVVP